MSSDKKSTRLAVLALAVMSLIWGYNWIIMKEAVKYCSAFDFAALRTFFGALVLFSFLISTGRNLRPQQVPLTILLGLLTTTGCVGLSTWALETGGAGKTAVLVYAMPFWLLLLSRPLLGERIESIQRVAVAVALVGLVAILEPWHTDGSVQGNLLAVSSGISWAGGAVALKIIHRRARDFDLISVTTWQLFFGSLPLVVVALVVPDRPIAWTPYLAGAVLFNIVFTSIVALLLWFYSLRELPAGIAGMGTLATPVIGVVAAAVQLGESLSLWEFSGMALIMAGLVLITLPGLLQYRHLRDIITGD
ncbi:MAG: EamA family transporter [Syntrophobacterales bacterium]|nr:EamA family transporter [Syntrophobacterales bacterium]